ncbi:MAG: class I SAM-dependent methyltransferase [Mycobacteriales bacterium]
MRSAVVLRIDQRARRARVAWEVPVGDRRTRQWPEAAVASTTAKSAQCNVCGWHGAAFGGVEHCESATCPVCGSIARDRFLYWCWTQRTSYDPKAVVLETSPRLDGTYRAKMCDRVSYLCSDFDQAAHAGQVVLDLQQIDLPDASIDLVLTPHVLEHVPDTDRALSELLRILRPGGHVLLQVPFLQSRTGRPPVPEYHGDSTLVHWRFGWDLAARTRGHGFETDVLVTSELSDAVTQGRSFSYAGSDCDVHDLLSGATGVELTPVADAEQAARHGFRPAFLFITLHLRKADPA